MDNEEKKDETPAVQAGIASGLTEREITEEVETAFLSYAMSVIEARAIPPRWLEARPAPCHLWHERSRHETGATL